MIYLRVPKHGSPYNEPIQTKSPQTHFFNYGFPRTQQISQRPPKNQSLKGHFAKHLQKSIFIPQKSTQKLPNISRRHFPPGRDHLFDIKNYKQIHQHSAINIVPVQVTPRFGILALSICFTATLRQHVEEWRCDKLQIELSFPQKQGKKHKKNTQTYNEIWSWWKHESHNWPSGHRHIIHSIMSPLLEVFMEKLKLSTLMYLAS